MLSLASNHRGLKGSMDEQDARISRAVGQGRDDCEKGGRRREGWGERGVSESSSLEEASITHTINKMNYRRGLKPNSAATRDNAADF